LKKKQKRSNTLHLVNENNFDETASTMSNAYEYADLINRLTRASMKTI